MKRKFSPYPKIWSVVERIPRGSVATYGTIARLSGIPNAPRVVGYALHALPTGLEIPWHRVINSKGKVSLPGTAGVRQCALLTKEGISLNNGVVDLARHAWPASDRKRHLHIGQGNRILQRRTRKR